MHPLLRVATPAFVVLVLSGCGQGRYTAEHATLAKTKLETLKAATEYDIALQSFLAGDLRKAERQATKALALNESAAEALVLLGRVHIENGDMGRAVESLERAAELRPDSVDAAYYLGIVSERLARPEEAAAHFRRAGDLAPYDPQHAIAAGEALIDMGRTGEAQSLLLASKVSSNSPGIRQLLGHIAIIEGRPDEAVDYFGQARLLAPDERAIAEDLARAQMAAGQFAEAEFGIARLRRTAGTADRRDLIHMHAECLLALDRAAEARSLFRDLTRDGAGSADPAAWIGLGQTAVIMGDAGEARRAASRLVALAGERPEGYVLFALAHGLAGENERALASIADGLAKAGPAADLHALQAMSLAQAGRRDEAQTALASAGSAGGDPDMLSKVRQRVEALAYASAPVE